MKKYWILLVLTLLIAFPSIVCAASVRNSDSKPHRIKGRTINGGWIYTTIYSGGTKYFRCRWGCQVVVHETGSEIVLESDEDLVISNGELRIK